MSRRLSASAALVAVAVIGGPTAAWSDAMPAQDLFAGRGCAGCHGEGGGQSIDAIPVLAGQKADYLFRQMKDIAGGRRIAGPGASGEPRTKAMKDTMAPVSEADMRAIADWLATVSPPAPTGGDAGMAAAGADLYEEFGCMGCHGVDGRTPVSDYPILAGQNREYLVLQTREIRDVLRTNGRTRVMVEFAHKLGNDDIDRIAAFLSRVDRTVPKP